VSAVVEDILWAVGLLAIMLLSLEVGFRAGSRAAEGGDTKGAGQVGAIQGAMLGLLGLLLGFSFAAAGARFLERQDLIVSEANAIGTAYARAELLDLPHRGDLRRALAEYTDHRLKVAGRIRGGLTEADYAAVNAYHTRMWTPRGPGSNRSPHSRLPCSIRSTPSSTSTRRAWPPAPSTSPGPSWVFWSRARCCRSGSSGTAAEPRGAAEPPSACLSRPHQLRPVDHDRPRPPPSGPAAAQRRPARSAAAASRSDPAPQRKLIRTSRPLFQSISPTCRTGSIVFGQKLPFQVQNTAPESWLAA
jgi:hypothetical protein